MNKKIEGICRFCWQTKALRSSHLLPRALYKYLRYDTHGQLSHREPFVLNNKVVLQTSRQVQDYLLCDHCESRLSTMGEQWVLEHCFRRPGDFPLQQILLSTPAQQELETGWVIETATVPGIEAAQLAYFAVSVFWRAAVHAWDIAGATAKRIRLGKAYEEKVRRYLLGDTAFPNDMVVLVKVASSQVPMTQAMHFPQSRSSPRVSHGRFHYHQFAIPGIAFDLLVGSRIPSNAREEGCIMHGHGHPIFLLKNDDFSRWAS